MVEILAAKEQTEINDALLRCGQDIFNQSINSSKILLGLSEKYAKYGQIYVATVDGEIAGLIAYYANDLSSKTAFLSMIIVHHNYQKQGIGQRLLNVMVSESVATGMKQIRLEVDLTNQRAIHFYEKNGFQFEAGSSDATAYMLKKINL